MSCKCYSKQEYRKKFIKKFILILSIIITIIVAFFAYFNFYVNPLILQANKAVIKSKTVSLINSSITKAIGEIDDYNDLINISYDNDGNITAITANSLIANQLNNLIIKNCQTELNDMTKLNFLVPLGSFSGIALLNGFGPNIKIKMVPIGSVETEFFSEFISQGINQTNHKIYIKVSSNISILLPGVDKTIKVNTQILISESIIVGKVPQVYFGSNNSLNTQLNLIP